jgi:hypothetical protein
MPEAAVDVISAVEQACLAGADAALRSGGFVPEPQVHMLIDDWDRPYVACVRTRPYRQGVDALRAIIRLGTAPAAIRASRVVLVWEHSDLCTSLRGPGEYETALVVLEASLTGEHTLRSHPVALHLGPPMQSGWPTVVPEWGAPVTVPGAVLPPVISGLLKTWRMLEGDKDTVFARLHAEGYPVVTALP